MRAVLDLVTHERPNMVLTLRAMTVPRTAEITMENHMARIMCFSDA